MIFKLLLTVAISAASICMVQGISNGRRATLRNSGFVVNIFIGEVFTCTGALVGSRFVVTLISCFENDVNPTTLLVSGNTLAPTKNSETPGVAIYRHPQYNELTLSHDVAMLKIAGDIAGATVIKLCSKKIVGALRVFGWGDVDENESRAQALMLADVSPIAKTLCIQALNESGIEDRSMTCTNNTNGAGMCTFDNGGPLVNSDNELCGLMSWREGCGSTGMPTVHTNINVVKLFILETKRK